MDAAEKFLQAAVAYAKAGLRIFPLAKESKAPAIAKKAGGRGHLDATTDEFQIRQWWTTYPCANIGFATGGGVLVIDVDVANGKRGAESFTQLEHQLGKLPDTRQVLSGSGGQQYYFAVPPDFENAKTLAEHIDLKGNGGYVVLPRSIHPDTKRAYEWDGLAGFDAPIAELPAAWLEAARRKPAPAAAAPDDPGQAEDYPPADLLPILGGCAWLQHTNEDAGTLSEPDWYAMLGVVGRCQDGAQHAHEFSKPYAGYSAADTDKKLAHALRDAGPVTCERVAGELGGQQKYCGQCRHFGKILSPIVLGQAAARLDEEWARALLRNKNKRPYGNLHNAAIALREHPELKGLLRFDTFREKAILGRGAPEGLPPGELDELRILGLAKWLQRTLAPTLSENIARSAVDYVARSAPVHVLREYLLGIQWDNVARVREGFFQRYFGAQAVTVHTSKEDQALYWDDAAVVFMVSAVARILRPGAPVDYLLVLEGTRGSHKAKALEILAGAPYFTNQLPARLDFSAAAEQVRGMWIVQLADLGAVLQHEYARQFIARRNDQYKPAYGRSGRITVDRQCVFAATTNERHYLYDDAGTRYILPVATGEIDLLGLNRDKPQLWAEAVWLFQQGAQWRPMKYLAAIYKREQEARLIGDPWAERVRFYASMNPDFTIAQLLEKFEVPFHLQSRSMELRIEKILLRQEFRAELLDTGDVVWHNPRAAQKGVSVQ